MRAICLILFAVVAFVAGDSFQQVNDQNTEQQTNADSVNVQDLSQGGYQTSVDNINMPDEQQQGQEQEQQSTSAHNSQDSVHSRSSWPWIGGYPVPSWLPNPSQTHTYPYPQYPVLQRPVGAAHGQNSWHPRRHHNSQVSSVDQLELGQQQDLPYFPNLPSWIRPNSNNYPYPSLHQVQQNQQQQHQKNRHAFWEQDEYKNVNEDGHEYDDEESYNWKQQLPSFLFSSKNDESDSAHNRARLGRGIVYYRRHFPSTRIPQREFFPY